LAEDAGALVIYDDPPRMVRDGLYTHSGDVAVIFLHPRLKGVMKQFVHFHELGHHVAGHNPGLGLTGADSHDRAQAEADYFAANAIRPGCLSLREAVENRRRRGHHRLILARLTGKGGAR
jgi:Zn-dependent peptidase ImmA (M78 family)